jgi:glycosyltransferase involved in cell wall biosynthesis
MKKPRILVFIPNYLPGYRNGGVLRTIVNTVDWLLDDCEFWIVTRDRDLGDTQQYPGISTTEWQLVEGAMVRYLGPDQLSLAALAELVNATPHDMIHLNSFFDPVFTIKMLIARRIGKLPRRPLVLSPRGEFVDGPLKLKYRKKIAYIALSKLAGFYRDIVWHASSQLEMRDFVKVLKLDASAVKVALDLPSKVNLETPAGALSSDGRLRLVFLSRLTREKNLDYALRTLKKVKADVVFDIFGPDEDAKYWEECRAIIQTLPSNVTVTYHGPVVPTQVAGIFGRYDMFFFPSRGENYGHVIAESVSVGTKVLISNNTPWLNLAREGLGWDVDLHDDSAFVGIIEDMAAKGQTARLKERQGVKENALKRLLDPKVVNDNRALFSVPEASRMSY